MMSHPFSISQMRSPTQDFIMMNNNNNYLPGVSRMNEGFQIPFTPQTPLTSEPGVSHVRSSFISASPLLTGPATSLNSALDFTVTDKIPDNSQLNQSCSLKTQLKDTVPSSGADIEVEMNPPDVCEHQGPLDSNLCHNSAWNNTSYHVGTLNQNNGNSFTFTTPTQSYLHSPALTVNTQNRFHNARVIPQTFAPGCNAQWKHSVPRKMPWLPHSSMSCPQGLSVFTGTQSSSVCSISQQSQNIAGTNTLYSPQMYQPVASCSELTRRHKRRHTVDTVGDDCPSNKIHLTEDKIARHMSDLRIHNISPPPGSVVPPGSVLPSGSMEPPVAVESPGSVLPSQPGSVILSEDDMVDSHESGMAAVVGDNMSDTCYPGQTNHNTCNNEFLRHSQRQWHDFKLLEEKLQMIDEDSASDNEDTSKCEPMLRIVDGIDVRPKEVLPQHIIDRIRNPCQEIVLWSPQPLPCKADDDNFCRDNDDNSEQTDMMDAQVCEDRVQENRVQEDRVQEDSGMETDPDDEDL